MWVAKDMPLKDILSLALSFLSLLPATVRWAPFPSCMLPACCDIPALLQAQDEQNPNQSFIPWVIFSCILLWKTKANINNECSWGGGLRSLINCRRPQISFWEMSSLLCYGKGHIVTSGATGSQRQSHCHETSLLPFMFSLWTTVMYKCWCCFASRRLMLYFRPQDIEEGEAGKEVRPSGLGVGRSKLMNRREFVLVARGVSLMSSSWCYRLPCTPGYQCFSSRFSNRTWPLPVSAHCKAT